MNIYFACSITGGRVDEGAYQRIVQILLGDGHQVPTAMLAQSDGIDEEASADPIEVYERDTAWIRGCDVVVAEISTPSHGVGYEIGYALSQGKRVLCLYRQDVKISKMISGNQDENLIRRAYSDHDDAIRILRRELDAPV